MMTKISYGGYRFPSEIVQQAIWLYVRFTLSLRDVEDLLAERGILVSYESVRRWVNHFGPMIAADLRKRRPKPHTIWHLDEVYLKIDGCMVYLWRAVDAEGEVLDVPVMRKLLKKYGFVPDKLITDELGSYAAAAGHLGIAKRHERGRWRNNRAENSHQPTRRIQERGIRAKISLSACRAYILSTSSAISPQQERTEPSGHQPCIHGTKSSLRREPNGPRDLLRALFGNVTEPARPVFQGCDDERQATLATDARNLIHAGKSGQDGLGCTKATALMALAALEAVMGELP
jgi:putative transposase